MVLLVIPIVRYWGNPTDYIPDFNTNQLTPGGVIDLSKKHSINRTLRNESISATVTNPSELDSFLLGRLGKPFEYRHDGENKTGDYTCIEWNFEWVVYVSNTASVALFSAIFNENVNPQDG